MKCIFLDGSSLEPDDLDIARLKASCSEFKFYNETSKTDLPARVQSADIIITNKFVIDESVINMAPRLKCIAVSATGTNNVDLEAARSRGIAVTNVQGYGSNTVAQHAMTLILALSTNLINYVQDVRSGAWARHHLFCLLNHPIQDLAGKHLVIVGSGEIGQALAKIADGFDMKVSFSASLRPETAAKAGAGSRLPLSRLLPDADVISLHCPLTEHTRNLIDAKALSTMKPSALLINTARGGLVDEQALVDALKDGQIGGAGFDVLTAEPPKNGNPLVDNILPNLIVTPHCAWGSREARQRMVDDIALSINAFIKGEKRSRVV